MMETNKSTDEIEINLGEIFALLLHKVWIIILAAVVCGAVGFLYSYFLITPQYQSTTKVTSLISRTVHQLLIVMYSFQQLFLRIMNSLLQAVML
ncbi:Wzz/FepE/Etk N-terminal domain-containing protein [Lachnospira eligens]|uniref:Wzz/FepE/Etk N-terminal domain-containing protein n=1 Tax=Lachnospira eligens TaxID=39485 RepID=UPI001FAA40CF|nr:Wzz/FepE/Etk N-terminal domain-containing protein [Lachnospira eligens]